MFNVKSYLKIQSFKDIQIRKFLQLMRENSWHGKFLGFNIKNLTEIQ